MNEIKSCVIIGPAHPLRGGIADLNEALARNLISAGIQSEIVSFYFQYPSFLFPGKTQLTEDPKSSDLVIHSLISSINPFSWIKAANFIREKKPDLVIIRYWLPFMAPALGTIARILKKKGIVVIAITDNVIPHEKRPGDLQLTRYFLNSCKGFLVMSKQVEAEINSFHLNKPVVYSPHPLYNIFGDPISKSEARKFLNLDETGHYALFLGFIRPYKGLDLLLEAMSHTTVREQNITLIVAGEFYDSPEKYYAIVKKLGLENKVIFHSEYIPKEKIRYYVCAADLLVQPYKTASQSGITQIAFHFRKPMLVTNVGGLSEIVKHMEVGYCVPVNSIAISSSLVDFYSMNREAKFVANINEESKRFEWKYFIESVLRLNEIVSQQNQ